MIWTLAETLLVCLVCWGIVLPLIARCIVLQTNKWLKRLTYTVPSRHTRHKLQKSLQADL